MPQIIKYHAHIKSNCTLGHTCTRVLTCEIGACDTCVRHMLHTFTIELVAGLNCKANPSHLMGESYRDTRTGTVKYTRQIFAHYLQVFIKFSSSSTVVIHPINMYTLRIMVRQYI